MCQTGIRVRVWNADRSQYLGEGVFVGFVQVYIFRNEDGSISSCENAEDIPMHVPGHSIERIESNPKIQLDSGKVVYGCQVWWSKIEE